MPHYKLIRIFEALAGLLGVKDEPSVPTQVAGTRVHLTPPPGFLEAPNFNGFVYPACKSSIIINELPAPFADVVRGFDAANLATRGLKLLHRESVEVSGLHGLLLNLRQKVLGEFHDKWVAVFGNSHNTVMVMATYPASDTALGDVLRRSALSVMWDPDMLVDPLADLPFMIRPPRGMQLAQRMQKMLMYTCDGKLQYESPRDPIFVIGQSIGASQENSLFDFSRKRLLQTDGYFDFEIKRERELRVSGLDAYEIDADAVDVRTHEPVVIYQLIIASMDDPTYFIAQGIVHRELAAQHMPVFESAALSFVLR